MRKDGKLADGLARARGMGAPSLLGRLSGAEWRVPSKERHLKDLDGLQRRRV